MRDMKATATQVCTRARAAIAAVAIDDEWNRRIKFTDTRRNLHVGDVSRLIKMTISKFLAGAYVNDANAALLNPRTSIARADVLATA